MHSSLLTWRGHHLKKIKDRSHNEQNISSSELPIRRFETYKKSLRPHEFHIYNYAADISMATMCPFPSQHHGTPQWKYIL